jgi:hypothetical protein
LGVRTFRWTTEKKISAWLTQLVWTGVCTSLRFGQALWRRSIDRWPRCADPLSTITNTRCAERYGSTVMNCSTSASNGTIPSFGAHRSKSWRGGRPMPRGSTARHRARTRARPSTRSRVQPTASGGSGRGPGSTASHQRTPPARRDATAHLPIDPHRDRGSGRPSRRSQGRAGRSTSGSSMAGSRPQPATARPRASRRNRGRVARGVSPPAQIAEVKALACELPSQSGVPLSRYSSSEIAREAVNRGIVAEISGTTCSPSWQNRLRQSDTD